MVKDKKAAIGIQINWIFVLIAGAIILMLVFAFVIKQKRASQIKAADTLIKDIEAIATTTATLKGGSQQISLPKTKVGIGCSEDCVCTINIKSLSKDFKEKQIFAPAELSGVNAVVWTKDWEVPFRVTNFLYITDRGIKYFLIHDESALSQKIKQLVEKQMPEAVNYEFININDLADLTDKGFDFTKFVFLGIPVNSNVDRSFKKTSAFVSIAEADITFLGKNPIPYISEAELFGAVFANDAEMYACNIENAKVRLDFLIQIYIERSKELDRLVSAQNLLCGYDKIINELNAFSNDKDIGGHYNLLKSLNEELVVKSCPLVY